MGQPAPPYGPQYGHGYAFPHPEPPPDPPELPLAARRWPRWPWWYGLAAFLAGAIVGLISAGIAWAALGVDDPGESPEAIIFGTLLLDGSLVGVALLFA
ncbi:MAG: hypothetical protein M3340_08900, partial [Actinomycetota bacterium]|nr:hypothetical protein [Actinomycetota bacterium]